MTVDQKAQVANAREEQQMSNENETQTALKTPEEWCRIERVEILDPDGWRGRGGRDFTDPISLAEFQERLATCTQRSTAVCSDCSALPGRDHSPSCLTQLAPQPAGPHHTGTLNLTGEGNEAEVASPISDEVVRRASFAFAEHRTPDWAYLPPEMQAVEAATCARSVRVTLTAALPALRRQIAEEIAAWADDLAAGVINRDKPYNQGFIHAGETMARHAREYGAR